MLAMEAIGVPKPPISTPTSRPCQSPVNPDSESLVNMRGFPVAPSRISYSSTVPAFEGKKGSGVCADARFSAIADAAETMRILFMLFCFQSFSSSWNMSSVGLPK